MHPIVPAPNGVGGVVGGGDKGARAQSEKEHHSTKRDDTRVSFTHLLFSIKRLELDVVPVAMNVYPQRPAVDLVNAQRHTASVSCDLFRQRHQQHAVGRG